MNRTALHSLQSILDDFWQQRSASRARSSAVAIEDTGVRVRQMQSLKSGQPCQPNHDYEKIIRQPGAGCRITFCRNAERLCWESTVVLCEVCGRPAVDRSPPGYGGVKINCPTCGNYSIAGSVRDKFRQLSLDERRRALERAKDHASLGMRPLIGATEL
jgi:hypothetical protein